MVSMANVSDEQDVDLLKAALDHVVRWNEFHVTSGLQVINFFLLAGSVLAAAYVSALNGNLHAIAGVIALVGGAAAVGTYLIGRRQSEIAQLAEEPLKELQDRIAESLAIESLRMAEEVHASRKDMWRRSSVAATATFLVIAGLSLTAAIYAWLSG